MRPKISKACSNEWTEDLIMEYYNILHGIAVDEWGYNIYPNQLEIVNAEGMLEAYTSIGMPITYPHWSFGKSFISLEHNYQRGRMGLAYEMICNSDPAISYLLEENTMTMQALVMAHACFGHNHVFKNNYLFKQWTMADYIIDYLRFAKHTIEKYEERYGYDRVERILDAAHAISVYSVEKYPRRKKKKTEIIDAKKKRMEWEQEHYDRLLPKEKTEAFGIENAPQIKPTENLLYFIEKYSPSLEDWEREVVRIVRKVNQYFYPQMHTKVLNEGFAVWTHHALIEELDKRGYVDDAFMLEFCHMHSNVITQLPYDHRWYHGINPYKLGWEIFCDIKRICETPTKEDESLFPYLVGQPFRKAMFDAVEDYKDESFVQQYLSPTVMRKMKLFTLIDQGPSYNYYEVSDIQNESGFKHVREALAKDLDLNTRVPQLEVTDVHWKSNRKLILTHKMYRNNPLDRLETDKVLSLIHDLWKFPIKILSVNHEGSIMKEYYYDGLDTMPTSPTAQPAGLTTGVI